MKTRLLLILFVCGCSQSPVLPGNGSPSASSTASPQPSASSQSNPAPTASAAAKGPTRLELSKTSFTAGENITLKYSVDPLSIQDKSAWIGLVPGDVPHGSATENDKFDLAYQYLEGKNSGELKFIAPEQPGNYDFRMHDSETTSGRELTSISFTVTGSAKPLIGNALALDKSRYAAGETMTITVSIRAEDKKDETAWLGIVPAAVDHGDEALNDRYNLGYKFLDKALFGKTTLVAPKAPGLYDIRLHDTDTNGRELAFISFVVE